MRDGFYRVVTSYLVAGFVVENGTVTKCAPSLRKNIEYWKTVAERIDPSADALDLMTPPERQTERTADMWNQGNGNGNGYGYGQGTDEVYDRMNHARDAGSARFPFIEAGTHTLAVVSIEKQPNKERDTTARILLKVLESTSPKHPVGSFVTKIYNLTKRPKFDNQLSDAELMADFCMKLKDAPRGYPIGNDIRVLLEDPSKGGRAAEQLARGTVIKCTGVANQKGNWVNLYWTSVAQTPEQIVAMRQRIEAEGIPGATASPQALAQGYPQHAQPPAQPAATQYPGTPTNVPAAPQGGFLAQIPPQGGGNPQGGNGGGRPW